MSEPDKLHAHYQETAHSGGQEHRLLALEAELFWLMENSDGVVGLSIDGSVMPWAKVRRLYLPSWFERNEGSGA